MSKKKEISEMSVEELREQLAETQKTYSSLKSTHAVSPLDNPMQLRHARKDIARLQTALTAKK